MWNTIYNKEMERKTRVPITRVNMWYDAEDFDFELDIATDFLENDSNVKVVLFSVDRVNTQLDDVYGESETTDIRFLSPVELLVSSLEIMASELKNYGANGSLSHSDRGNLTFTVLVKTLEGQKADIRRGDFIGYNSTEESLQYYTVVNDGRINGDNAHTLYGIKPYFRSIICVAADPNQFNGL